MCLCAKCVLDTRARMHAHKHTRTHTHTNTHTQTHTRGQKVKLEGSDSSEAHPPQRASKSIKTTKKMKSANNIALEESSERAKGVKRKASGKGGSTKTLKHTDSGASKAKSKKVSGQRSTKRDGSEYSRQSTPAKEKKRKRQ